MSKPDRGITTHILIGMAAGLVVGAVLNAVGTQSAVTSFAVDSVFHVGGALFLASLQLMVVPLVFVSLVCGTAALEDVTRLGRIGGKTVGLYLLTTAIAISIALLAAILLQPGVGIELHTELAYAAGDPPTLGETLIGLIPTNPIRAMAQGNVLQVIVFAVLFGLAATLSGAPGRKLIGVFEDANVVILRLVTMLIRVAPYGVFCLVAKVFAGQGLGAILPLAKYFFLVLAVLAIHAAVTYPALLSLLGRLNPRTFYRNMKDPMLLAFSTASSNATLPVTLANAENRLGVHNAVASFTIPLGATINMDGTAIMQGVATVFIAQAYGIDIGPSGYLMVVVTATLASIGTAGVPGVGLIMLAMVLRQVNLPVEGIGLIIGIDRLLDMTRTAVNVAGDCAVTCIVARSEGQLDEGIFRESNGPPQAAAPPPAS